MHDTVSWAFREALRITCDNVWGAVIITAAAYAAFVGCRLDAVGDWSRFVSAGDQYCDPTATPEALFVAKNSSGYDGQFYYRLSLAPFSHRAIERGIRFDSPPYRSQRIIYPL